MDEGLYLEAYADQPAYIVPPVAHYSDGPSGFKRNPGGALSDEWRGWFFLGEFKGTPARSLVSGFTLKPKGATFALDEQAIVAKGITATGLAFDPAGSLYVAEWMNGWDVSEEGRVWKIDTQGEPSKLRTETARLLGEGFEHRETSELVALLNHADRRVRLGAQLRLVARKSYQELEIVAMDKTAPPLPRVHAIYGLGIAARREGYEPKSYSLLMTDDSAEVRVATLRNLTELNHVTGQTINHLSTDPEPRVRFYVAQTLGRLKGIHADIQLPSLLNLFGDDPYMRHAASYSLSQLGDAEALARFTDHKNRYVRAAAAVALRRLKSPLVARFLDDEDAYVAAEAARAIHDDFSIPEAMGALAQSLEITPHTDEAFLRRAINANLRHATPAPTAPTPVTPTAAVRLMNFASRADAPPAMRALAINTLALFADPPTFDMVEGRAREIGPRDHEKARRALMVRFNENIDTATPLAVRLASVRAAGQLGCLETTPLLVKLAIAENELPELRVATIQALARLQAAELKSAVTVALNAEDESLRATAQALLPQADPHAALDQLRATLNASRVSLREKQAAMLALAELPDELTAPELVRWLDSLIAGRVDAGLMLELLETAERSSNAGVRAKLATFEASRADQPLTERYAEALAGGSHTEGRKLFNTHAAAQCARCHIVDGVGGAIGPDLSKIASRVDREHLLQAIVEPGAVVAEGFGLITVIQKDGGALAGIVRKETEDELTLMTLDNQTHVVKKNSITQRTAPISSMPPMTGVLSKREIRDLVAYLGRLK
jgi:putative heme-binding domain-containing protein